MLQERRTSAEDSGKQILFPSRINALWVEDDFLPPPHPSLLEKAFEFQEKRTQVTRSGGRQLKIPENKSSSLSRINALLVEDDFLPPTPPSLLEKATEFQEKLSKRQNEYISNQIRRKLIIKRVPNLTSRTQNHVPSIRKFPQRMVTNSISDPPHQILGDIEQRQLPRYVRESNSGISVATLQERRTSAEDSGKQILFPSRINAL
ncbi:hypothetical protein CDAR_205081 [Caerostris darwini]|uniref:Uncharacterized protein n=1 Tax=Caerostris darwini TaxID=1538125 RepID=A0AAV4Q000_9ARAC|nr:hypothetical protein CDAR_205081 [Caerostris darwini]